MPPPAYTPYSLAGQCVLITGASSGIGEACAWRFAAEGCRLALVARRGDRLDALASELRGAYPGLPVLALAADLADAAAVDALPGRLAAEGFAEVDILLNNAGLALGADEAHALSLADARAMIDVNVTAVVALTRAFVPGMRARNRGHLINLSSVAAHEAYAGGSVYCATKHAVGALTAAARHELAGTLVRVTAVSPGAVRTEFSLVRFRGDAAAADAVYAGIEPLTGADVADAVAYAATRPPHVQVAEVTVFATHQSSAKGLARVLLDT